MNGLGVPTDVVRAYAWLSLAVDNGNKGAEIKRSALEKRMSPALLAGARTETERIFATFKTK